MVLSSANKKSLSKFMLKYKKSMTKEQKKALAKQIADYIQKTYSNIRTVTSKTSEAKNMFMKMTKDPDLYLNIVPKSDITKRVVRMNEKKLETQREFKTIPKKYVDGINKQFRNSKDIYELAYYILLNTGRRISELVKNVDRFKNKPRSKNSILFDGILKKRGEAEQVNIITIDNKKNVMRAINRFKKIFKFRNKKSFGRSLSNNITKISGEHKFSSHDLRSVYANYLFAFRNPENQIYNAFIRKVLNHKFLLTSINYADIKVV